MKISRLSKILKRSLAIVLGVGIVGFPHWSYASEDNSALGTPTNLDLSLEFFGLSTRTRSTLRKDGIITLREFRERLLAEGPHFLLGLGPKVVLELETLPATSQIFAESRVAPELGPLYKLSISTRLRRALERENIWNLRELRIEFERRGKVGMKKIHRIDNGGVLVIEQILSNEFGTCTQLLLPLEF